MKNNTKNSFNSKPKETILSIVFLTIILALAYFSMWGAHILGLLN